MRAAIITTAEEGYHKQLCAEIATVCEVVGVLHPARRRAARLIDLGAHQRSIARDGLAYHVLRKAGSNKLKRLGWDFAADVAAAEAQFFPQAEQSYAPLAARARHIADINGAEGVAALRDLKADIAIASGGPVYRKALLAAVPLAVNYHTGISPLYNGSQSIFWPLIDNCPQATGGTLMVMNESVDGGDMLAHFLPAIEAGDTPGRLFMKTLAGGFGLLRRFLPRVAEGRPFVGAPQGRPLRYTRAADWSVHQNLIAGRRIAEDACAKHVRGASASIYWDLPDRAAATEAARATLTRLVYAA